MAGRPGYLIGNPGGAGAGGYPATRASGQVVTSTMTDNGLITSGPLRGTKFNADGTVSSVRRSSTAPSPARSIHSATDSDWQRRRCRRRTGFTWRFRCASSSIATPRYTHAKFDFTDTSKVSLKVLMDAPRAAIYVTDLRSTGNLTIRRDNAYLPASLGARMDQLGVSHVQLRPHHHAADGRRARGCHAPDLSRWQPA